MFSVVVVYNREQELNRVLLPSLKKQTVEYEYIPIDNTKGQYKSAAQALNYGGLLALSKYIMFLHQDTELGSSSWLADTEKLLDNISHLGIAGIVGMSTEGKNFEDHVKGYMCSSGQDIGKPFSPPQAVQTLDECLLIVPRQVFRRYQFDSHTFDGWHCYGCDLSLTMQENGLKAYAVSAYALHRHKIVSDTKYLPKYQRRLYAKHRKHFGVIYTTCGVLSGLRLALSPVGELLLRARKRSSLGWLKEFEGCESVLDLGCGPNSPLQGCEIPYTVGVEIFEPYLEESRKKVIHNEYIKADIRVINFQPKSFDIVFASEVLEHMPKEDGLRLLDKMSLWAKRKVIITTPNGYSYKDILDSNPYQVHRSVWTVSELRAAGFKVYGLNGWKFLRNTESMVKYKPTFMWEMISGVTQQVVRRTPGLAFQLLAVKKIRG